MLDFCAEHGIGATVEVISADEVDEAYDKVVGSQGALPVRHRHEHHHPHGLSTQLGTTSSSSSAASARVCSTLRSTAPGSSRTRSASQ